VNQIPLEGFELEEYIKAADLDIETEQVRYPSPINIKAHVTKDKDVINIACHLKGVKKQTCGRCLSEFEIPFNKVLDFVYKAKGDNKIDLDREIRDFLILDYPIVILCKQDCKGLCSTCGANLNEGDCSCKK
jgi:uncharacterized protein